MKNEKGLAGRPVTPRETGIQSTVPGRTISLQPMFVTNRTTLEEIDNHLASAETRIVVITIEKGNRHGEVVVQHIGASYSDVRVVLVCEGSAQDILAMAFKPGVWACVGRQSSVETLREAIDTVAAGARYVAPELVNNKSTSSYGSPEQQNLGNQINPLADQDEGAQLTRRERQVLTLIAQGRPRREIAELLKVSPRTIDAYRARLLQKLNLDSSVQLVKYAISAGMAS
ncbi:response regulator transcription factor [Limnobacter sp.]|uniref:response regulator transcription factor n=1 Tax=Limnobacter sp. TaxID=2003368 RepID=UPI0025BD5C14|nr:response regulator transcription factor [Limnobacter sp.]